MACLNTLKLEIKTLEQVFPKNHERFQIMSASVDELSCRFVGKNGKKYEIHANITVSISVNSNINAISTMSFRVIVDYKSNNLRKCRQRQLFIIGFRLTTQPTKQCIPVSITSSLQKTVFPHNVGSVTRYYYRVTCISLI